MQMAVGITSATFAQVLSLPWYVSSFTWRHQLTSEQLSIGTLMGALIAGPVADKFGRKWSISAWCIMLHIGLVVQISAPEPKWYQSK